MSTSDSPLEQTWSLCDLALHPLKSNVLPSLQGIADLYYASLREIMTEICHSHADDGKIKMLDCLKLQNDELLSDVISHIDFLQEIVSGCKKRRNNHSITDINYKHESSYDDSLMDVVFLNDKDAASS